MVGDKLRFRFEKAGDLRLLSHHDLMRCAERMMRRAAVPFKMTAGFHPTPRLVFALSLSLGIVGRNEVVELELTEPRDAADVLAAFRRQAPAGWNFHSATVVPMKASAVPRRIVYRLPLPADRVDGVREIAQGLMAAGEVWVDRYHPRPRQVNIRPYLRGIRVSDAGGPGTAGVPPAHLPRSGNLSLVAGSEAGGTPAVPAKTAALLLDLWVTPTGTARADELLKLLRVADLPDAGAVLERTELELTDETPPDATDGPPTGPAVTRPLDLPSGAVPDDDEPSPTATWGLSPNGPVVE
jgi:radical SAM-linked protein